MLGIRPLELWVARYCNESISIITIAIGVTTFSEGIHVAAVAIINKQIVQQYLEE